MPMSAQSCVGWCRRGCSTYGWASGAWACAPAFAGRHGMETRDCIVVACFAAWMEGRRGNTITSLRLCGQECECMLWLTRHALTFAACDPSCFPGHDPSMPTNHRQQHHLADCGAGVHDDAEAAIHSVEWTPACSTASRRLRVAAQLALDTLGMIAAAQSRHLGSAANAVPPQATTDPSPGMSLPLTGPFMPVGGGSTLDPALSAAVGPKQHWREGANGGDSWATVKKNKRHSDGAMRAPVVDKGNGRVQD